MEFKYSIPKVHAYIRIKDYIFKKNINEKNGQ